MHVRNQIVRVIVTIAMVLLLLANLIFNVR